MKVAYDFLCLDERDSPNLSELKGLTRKEIKEKSNKRFFGLCGVIIPDALYPEINVEGRRIQERVLGKNNYQPFHYVEILNLTKNWAWLGKDPKKLSSVRDLLGNFISGSKVKIVGSFVDKEGIALQFGEFEGRKLSGIRRLKPNLHGPTTPKKINLYMISLKFILQKYHKYLSDRKKRGLIIAEARGEVEDKHLLNAFYTFQKLGAGSLSGKQIREHITDLLIVRKSQNHIGCQMADLVTYPVYDYFVPGHNTRNDHFLSKESVESKIFSIDVFPKNKKGA